MARKPGKYDAILPTLNELPPDPDRQTAIEAVKKLITNRDPIAVSDQYIKLRNAKLELQKKLTEVELYIDAHEQILTSSQASGDHAWGRYGVRPNALRLASGDTIRIQKEPVGKVSDKEAYRLWCIDNGYERQLQLWPSTTNAIIKERLLKGEPEPDGTEAYFYNKIVYVKSGAGDDE